MEKLAVIALGSNLGDSLQILQDAVKALARIPGIQVVKGSQIYRTAPVGYQDQDDFLNGAVLIRTILSPETLLGICLGIEAGFGRERRILNGPRTLDLDLIAMEDELRCDPVLTLPHPRYDQRAFVCFPLRDLFPAGDCLGLVFSHQTFPGQIIQKTAFSLTDPS